MSELEVQKALTDNAIQLCLKNNLKQKVLAKQIEQLKDKSKANILKILEKEFNKK